MAHLLIRFTTAPYSVSQASDGLDFAMAATNYGHEVSILFEGDGIYQLTEQAPQQQGVKNQFKRLKALPFFDIEDCYYVQSDYATRRITGRDVLKTVKALADDEVPALIERVDHVVTF